MMLYCRFVEKYHTQDIFSKVISANQSVPPVFALFLTFNGNKKGSELTIGGYDSSKVKGGGYSKWQVAHMYR